MSAHLAALLYCDEPAVDCENGGNVFEPDEYSSTIAAVRRRARAAGWTRPLVNGKRRDRCRECTERVKRERAAALSVTTREGLLASEWVLRTGLAERERDRLAARVAELEAAARGKGAT